MPKYETRPGPDFDHEEKGGYPGGPTPEGEPPKIPPLFKPFIPPSTPTPAETPTQPPPPEASAEQG
jgi:hypothetical protein